MRQQSILLYAEFVEDDQTIRVWIGPWTVVEHNTKNPIRKMDLKQTQETKI